MCVQFEGAQLLSARAVRLHTDQRVFVRARVGRHSGPVRSGPSLSPHCSRLLITLLSEHLSIISDIIRCTIWTYITSTCWITGGDTASHFGCNAAERHAAADPRAVRHALSFDHRECKFFLFDGPLWHSSRRREESFAMLRYARA